MGVAGEKIRTGKTVRTRVSLDEDLLREAMELTGIDTTRAVLEEALRRLVRLKKQERILELYGTIEWEGDLDESRKGRFTDADR